MPKKIYLCKEPFSIENQIITPTLKIRRHQAKKFFAKEINKLYGFNNEIWIWSLILTKIFFALKAYVYIYVYL